MAKVTKFKDRQNNILLPVTRATLVEMNNGDSAQIAYEGVNITHYTKDEINAAGYITYQALSSYVSRSEIENAYFVTQNDLSSAGYLTEHQDLSSYVNTSYYDVDTKKIYLSHDNDVISEIDTTEFSVETSVEINYADLVDLRDNGELVPGTKYRITDYVTTTTQANTQAAGHQFDIIVTALNTNALNENAAAIQHEGDTYFAKSKLNAWQLKYSLENDKVKYGWADTANGKGVIWYMKDEWNNECCYDFKNIMFTRKLTNGALDDDNGTDTFVYTFNGYLAGNQMDLSNGIDLAIAGGSGYITMCSENIIKSFYMYMNQESVVQGNGLVVLNDNVFLCSANNIGEISNLFVFGNVFEEGCFMNTLHGYAQKNVFGEYCNHNTLLKNCYSNTFGNECTRNTFGNDCTYNTFGDNCFYNTFGNYCDGNTFGNNCYSNTFVNYCHYNMFGNNCYSISFGTEATPINYVKYIKVENGVKYVDITTTATTSNIAYLQNITISQGISGTENTRKTIAHPTTNDDFQTIYRNDEDGTTEGGIVALKSDLENLNINTKNVVAATNSFITSTTTPLPNGSVYINHISNDTVKSSLKIYGSYGVNVVADASAYISVEHATKGLLQNTFGYYAVKTDDYGHTTIGSQLSYQYINQITNFNYTVIKDTDIDELSEIDANDFIKDGMVDTAYVQGSYLVISFNTDAGKQPIEVPIADIFNPTDYYTKTEINNAAYLQSETDPTVPSYVKGITETDISNWSSYANVQSDWNETDSTLNSYILNKPTIPNGLPTVSSTDNGKVLQVVNGEWSLVSPVTLYTGTGTPNNSQGNNGDLYMQI